MAETPEYRTVVSCLKQLETALLRCDRDTTHFLLQKGFITTEVHDEVVSQGSNWTAHQKAGILVSGIMRKVALSAQNHNTLVYHFENSGKYYKSIVAILNKEYTRQIKICDAMTDQQLPGPLPKLSYALSRYRKYLKSYYKNHSIARDDKLSIAPCSEFINPVLVKKECYSEPTTYDSFSKSTFHGPIDKIVAVKSPIRIDELFNSDSRFVLVEGPNGIGKSTLCWELCRKWDSYKFLQAFKIVLQLKLRKERVQNAKELQELFYHRDKSLSQRVADEVQECEGEDVLLILDGIDEMPTSVVCNKNSLLMEIIDGQCLPNVTCLVTSRPSASHYKDKFPDNHRHLEILGFTDDCKIKYAELAFKNNSEVLKHFKNFILSNPFVNSHLYIPINCAIFAQIYQDIGLKGHMILPKTMTQLYSTLSLVLIRRHMIQIGEWDEYSEIPNKIERLPKKIYTSFKRVCELAYRGLFAKKVKLIFTADDVGKDFTHLGLMSVSTATYVDLGAKATYSFFHLSMQEFLAAWHTTTHSYLITRASYYFDDLNKIPSWWKLPAHLNAYVRFLAGLVGLSKLLTMPVRIYYRDMTLLHCFFESQNPTQDLLENHAIILFIDSSSDAHVFGYALTHATINWNVVHIAIKDMDTLLSSLSYYSRNHQISGTIDRLMLVSEGDGNFSLPLDASAKNLLQSLSYFELEIRDFISIEYVAVLISAMSNLSAVKISIIQVAKQDIKNDYMLFKALQSLQALTKASFSIEGYTLSNRGVHNFITFFHENSTLETVELYFYNSHPEFTSSGDMKISFVLGNNYHTIIQSVFSCPNLASFTTNVPFITSKLPSSLKHLCYDKKTLLSTYTISAIKRCICHIADLCANSSLMTSTIRFSIPPQNLRIFLSILNKSLNKSNFEIHIGMKYDLLSKTSVLSHSLRKDVSTHQSFLKKSNSLCDLATNTRINEDQRRNTSVPFVRRYHSCPDLFHLHKLHPKLYKEVFKDILKIQHSTSKHKLDRAV